jgi:hypothetical protein
MGCRTLAAVRPAASARAPPQSSTRCGPAPAGGDLLALEGDRGALRVVLVVGFASRDAATILGVLALEVGDGALRLVRAPLPAASAST